MQPVAALQSEYSIWERNIEADVLPVLRELGIGIVPFSPLGRGFLAGTARRAEEYPADDFRAQNAPRLQGGNFDRNLAIANLVKEIAAAHGVLPGQVALARLLAQGEDIVPIPGTKRRVYLEQNLAAAGVVLDADDLRRPDGALERIGVAGARYTEKALAMIDR